MEITQIKPEERNIPQKIGDLCIRNISWNNFKGKANHSLPYSAHIYWTIDYEVVPSTKKKKSFVRVDVRILPKSWAKDNRNPHLLMHQYGHYLIGCICALSFQKKIYHIKHPTTVNVNDWIKSIFKETLQEYLKLQKLYDEETDHRLNFEKQEEWEQCIIKTLQQYKNMHDKVKTKEFKIHKFPKIKNTNNK